MRVVVTGAAGTLGRSLVPRLSADGHNVVGLDVVAGAGAEWVVADIRERAAVLDAVEGADIVVHSAALHGIHLADHSAREFYELNLTGTFNVWEAAVAHKVRGVVFSSTMGVYGDSRRPPSEDAVAFLDEDLPLLPGDVYGWTKLVGEELCRYHLRRDGIPSIALRYGMFVPEPFFRYGIRLLYGGVHEDDVADAVVAAVAAFGHRTVGFEPYNVESPLPFTPADGPDLRADPLLAVERHWPGSRQFLLGRGVRSLKPITEVFPIARLEAGLSVRPRHGFGQWLEELAARPEDTAESDPPWP
ncbi:MAG: NAD-dependent epimerase/dehydratase family protein [Chloroflexota bacterium]